jgi:hypothetical protein
MQQHKRTSPALPRDLSPQLSTSDTAVPAAGCNFAHTTDAPLLFSPDAPSLAAVTPGTRVKARHAPVPLSLQSPVSPPAAAVAAPASTPLPPPPAASSASRPAASTSSSGRGSGKALAPQEAQQKQSQTGAALGAGVTKGGWSASAFASSRPRGRMQLQDETEPCSHADVIEDGGGLLGNSPLRHFYFPVLRMMSDDDA